MAVFLFTQYTEVLEIHEKIFLKNNTANKV